MKVPETKDLKSLTPARDVVLGVVRGSSEHLTANAVFDNARQELPGISFATVYNSLRYLREMGLIGEIRFGNGSSRYDRMTQRHDHAICTECGKLVDIEMEIPEAVLKRAAKESRFKPERLEFTLRGLCPDCD